MDQHDASKIDEMEGGSKTNWMKTTYSYQLNKPFGFKWMNPQRPQMRVPLPDYRSQAMFKMFARNKLPMVQVKGKIVFKYIEETLTNKKILDTATKERDGLGEDSLPIVVDSKLRDLRTRHRVFIMDPPPGFDPYCKDHWVQFFTTIINMKRRESNKSLGSQKSSLPAKGAPPKTLLKTKIKTTVTGATKQMKPPKMKDLQHKGRRAPLIVFPGVSITKKVEPNPAALNIPSTAEFPLFDFEKIKEMLPKLESSTKELSAQTDALADITSSTSDVKIPLPAASDSLHFYKKKLQKALDDSEITSSTETEKSEAIRE